MVFMAATGHFGHGFFDSGGTAAPDWIRQHPQIINQTVGCMAIEHFGCNEWEDIKKGSTLSYEASLESYSSRRFSSRIRRSGGPGAPLRQRNYPNPDLQIRCCLRSQTPRLLARSIALASSAAARSPA